MSSAFPARKSRATKTTSTGGGIPGGWIFDAGGWCVFIETKVSASFRASQIESHRRTAARRGFRRITAVVITALRSQKLPPGAVHLEWSAIYTWLRKHASISPWAARTAEFLEIAEAKLIERKQ